jgi:putative Mg2+ transporter-C (MgtC) family protein
VPTEWALLARVAVGFTLALIIGFERELRGSVAGDRTFALVGGGSAVIAAVVGHASPQALGGIVTGIGFIGAGVVVHTEQTLIRGITTASAIYATAAVGIVVGLGHLVMGAVTAAAILLILESRNMPVLRVLDARRYQPRFRDDNAPPKPL